MVQIAVCAKRAPGNMLDREYSSRWPCCGTVSRPSHREKAGSRTQPTFLGLPGMFANWRVQVP